MQTCLVVRNSFHMLPLEEKNWRRQQYARARKSTAEADVQAGGKAPTTTAPRTTAQPRLRIPFTPHLPDPPSDTSPIESLHDPPTPTLTSPATSASPWCADELPGCTALTARG